MKRTSGQTLSSRHTLVWSPLCKDRIEVQSAGRCSLSVEGRDTFMGLANFGFYFVHVHMPVRNLNVVSAKMVIAESMGYCVMSRSTLGRFSMACDADTVRCYMGPACPVCTSRIKAAVSRREFRILGSKNCGVCTIDQFLICTEVTLYSCVIRFRSSIKVPAVFTEVFHRFL
jgi:hypothetical protein